MSSGWLWMRGFLWTVTGRVDRVPPGVFGRHKAKLRHKLAWIYEPRDVAESATYVVAGAMQSSSTI